MGDQAAAIECRQCHHSNPLGSLQCHVCHTPFPSEDQTLTGAITLSSDPGAATPASTPGKTVAGASAWSGATAAAGAQQVSFEPGSIVAGRYEIQELLGEGGMGAVYKALDRELDRTVALKVIRPELAGSSEILSRFKQEIILARQITHRNVIRIYDLGAAGHVRFITMEYVEGEDLNKLSRKKKFTPAEAVDIARQVCAALDAAHAESVVHRDLKPHNIMIGANGKASVMDFGLARTFESNGMTQAGLVLGTPAYMSPEQAKGVASDHRSDIFALGIVLYEMLTGVTPFKAETALATLLKRTQGPPPAPSTLNPAVTPEMDSVVAKALAVEPDARYQTAKDFLADLDALGGVSASRSSASALPMPALPNAKAAGSRKWMYVAVALAVLLLAIPIAWWRMRGGSPAPVGKSVSVLVSDFDNATGDPIFDNTLEPMFTLALEGAPFIAGYNRNQAHSLATQLRPGATRVDESLARLIARREGVTVVVSGSISRSGSDYKVVVKAIDAVTGKTIATRQTQTGSRDGVLSLMGKLAAPIRKALGDATPESAQLAAAETVSSSSLEAAHDYALGQDLMWQGKLDEAAQAYSKAVQLDPKLGRAYAGLALTYLNRKRTAEAGEYYKKALSLLDRMSERERYRTLGTYYLSYVQNYGKAIETLRKLVALYPADTAGYNNLGIAYAYAHNLPEAAAAARRALEISPNNVQTRLNFAETSMQAGDFQTAITESQRILKQNPGYELAYLPLALSALAQGDVQPARDAYARLEKLSPAGFSLAKAGQADLEMYLGRYKAALAPLESGIEADTKQNSAGEMAVKYVAKAEAQLASGQRAQSIESAGRAVATSPVESVLYFAARVFVHAGDEARARAVANRLESMLQTQTKSDALLINGEIALEHGRFTDAVEALQSAQKLQDLWISHFLLGRAYTEAGHFAEALAEFEICSKRKGEAADLFLADMSTIRLLSPLYYWTGRAQQGLGTVEAARTSYQEFLKLRTDADPGDPLAADAKRRAAASR